MQQHWRNNLLLRHFCYSVWTKKRTEQSLIKQCSPWSYCNKIPNIGAVSTVRKVWRKSTRQTTVTVVQRALAGKEVDFGGRKSSKTVCLFTRIATITTKPLHPRVPRGSRICEERSGQGKSVFPEISVNTDSPAQVNIHRCRPGQWEWFYIWTCTYVSCSNILSGYAELFQIFNALNELRKSMLYKNIIIYLIIFTENSGLLKQMLKKKVCLKKGIQSINF